MGTWLMWATWIVPIVLVVVILTVRVAGTRGSVATNLSDMFRRTRLTDPVAASAQVVSASSPPRSGQNAGRAMCALNLVITVPGRQSVATDTACLAPLAKWPTPGMTLPVTADRSDLRRFKIDWDQVATGWDTGVAQAQQLADQINAGTGAPTDPGGSGIGGPKVVTTSSITINGKPASAADIAPFETMTGMDLDGDGVIGGAAPGGAGHPEAEPPSGHGGTWGGATVLSGDQATAFLGTFLAGNTPGAAARSGGDGSHGAATGGDASDPVARLERLSALHASGAITDAEYAEAKRQVLGQP